MASQLCARSSSSALSSSSSSSSSVAVRPSLRRASVVVRASAPLPQGVTAPKRLPETPLARFGFVTWAEKINGRAAMLGFIGTVLVEAIAHRGVLEIAGLTVGNGLGFEL